MAEKHIFTNKEIENDIITALKNPPSPPEMNRDKWLPFVFLISGVIVVLGLFYYWYVVMFLLYFLLALLVYVIGYRLYKIFSVKYQIKNVLFSDYCISREVVSYLHEEHYIVRGPRFRRGLIWLLFRPYRNVDNYNICFENKNMWRIPKLNYLWADEHSMTDYAIFKDVHRGDEMYVVTKKKNGKIVMAYHTDLFEYKN